MDAQWPQPKASVLPHNISFSLLLSCSTTDSCWPRNLLTIKVIIAATRTSAESHVQSIWFPQVSGPITKTRIIKKIVRTVARTALIPGEPSMYLCMHAATKASVIKPQAATTMRAFARSVTPSEYRPNASPQRPMMSPKPPLISPRLMMIRSIAPGQPRKGPKTVSNPWTIALCFGWQGQIFEGPDMQPYRRPRSVPMITDIHKKIEMYKAAIAGCRCV
mmetsp:Transcript_81807/g.226662  ORF Transcript_81807/g.226662 Transcript_81807/m.226662 type:complete len:219 (-) Transcript_81807:71-727(-)